MKKRKGIEAINALIGDEEQNGKQKEEEKEETDTQSQIPWTIWLVLKTNRDHTVGLF